MRCISRRKFHEKLFFGGENQAGIFSRENGVSIPCFQLKQEKESVAEEWDLQARFDYKVRTASARAVRVYHAMRGKQSTVTGSTVEDLSHNVDWTCVGKHGV